MLIAQNFASLVHLQLKIYNKLVPNCFHVPNPSSYEIKSSSGSSRKFCFLFSACFLLCFILTVQTFVYLKYSETNPAVTIQSILYTSLHIIEVVIAWKVYQMRHQLTYLFNNLILFETHHNGN